MKKPNYKILTKKQLLGDIIDVLQLQDSELVEAFSQDTEYIESILEGKTDWEKKIFKAQLKATKDIIIPFRDDGKLGVVFEKKNGEWCYTENFLAEGPIHYFNRNNLIYEGDIVRLTSNYRNLPRGVEGEVHETFPGTSNKTAIEYEVEFMERDEDGNLLWLDWFTVPVDAVELVKRRLEDGTYTEDNLDELPPEVADRNARIKKKYKEFPTYRT